MFRLLKTIVKICIILVVILLALGAFVVFGGSCSSIMPKPINDVRTAIINKALDVSGIKERINNALRDSIPTIAEKTGLSEASIEAAIESLDIMSWEVVDLPSNAVETGTYTLPYNGSTVELTTYDTSEIVTVKAYDQTLTMKVPNSARSYIAFLGYLR